ncbi:RmlC-like cupin [Mycena venus]|uniref:RmlC-like cupin n=1 Tax=Mycena venus TaxID=2733690 RepID=A0A8H6YP00_9AGAR|nr:RmlC-like cupin [Mycena venus]
MFSPNKWASLALALALAGRVSADAKSDEAALVAKLRDAPTAVDRINLLPTDDEFEFDFFDPTKGATVGAGGKIVTANAATFPAVIGTGSAMAIGFLDACSMNTPHMHPRATEMQFSVNGTIRTGMITENNARFIMTELPPGSMTIFPQGAVHFQVNDGCEPALFVASFNSEDPGVLQVAQRFLGLPPDIVGATLGDLGVEEVAGLESMIPDNVAIATDDCLKRCGLKRPDQPTTQRQSRVSGNAFPTEVSASYKYSTYNDGYQYKSDSAYNERMNTASGYSATDYKTSTYTTPKPQSYATATATVSHGKSTWTTVYTSYAGSAYPTYAPSPVNHLIKVGADGLNFTPPFISAAIGDTVTFEFHPKNHTVTQSSFMHPCKALAETSTTGEVGFKSGFQFVAEGTTSGFPTFSIVVNDTAPIWGYCGQQGPPVHCTQGMVFAINPVESGPNNFAAFQQLARNSGSSISSSVICPDKDKDNTPLTASSPFNDEGNTFASCTYPSAGLCAYFSDGSFSSGSSTCPAGLPQLPGFGQASTTTTGKTSYPTTTTHATYNSASAASAYSAAASMLSQYMGGNGYPSGMPGGMDAYSSLLAGYGGQGFPSNIPGMSGFPGFGADLAAATDGSSSDGSSGSNKPSPALIALLAINGFLVVGLIVLGALYFRKRRAAARTSRHKQLYTSLSASGDPLFVAPTKLTQYEDKEGHAAAAAGDETPLTHGLAHGPYYDPHEPSSRTPSRPPSRLR